MEPFLGTQRKTVEIIAHRGFNLLFPENTLVAFRKALALGAHAVELDVQMSRDGVPVVLHDTSVDRTTNGHGPVNKKTLKQLKKLDAGSKFSLHYKNEKIPSLKEALLTIKDKGRVYVELKNTVNPSDLERVLFEIYKCSMEKYVSIISFDFKQLEKVRHLNPTIPLGKLILPEDINIDRMLNFNIKLFCAPYQVFLSEPAITLMLKKNHLTSYAYGIATPNTARALLLREVSLLCCDKAL